MVILLREMPNNPLKDLTMNGDTYTNFPSASQEENNSLSTNDRNEEVKRTAEELAYARHVKAQYLARHAGPNAPEFFRMLWPVMLNPNLSPTEKLVYTVGLAERFNFKWSNDHTGALLGVCAKTVQRAFKSLEREGAITTQHHRREPAVRVFNEVPVEEATARLAAELYNQQLVRAESKAKFEKQERTSVSIKNGHARPPTSYIYTSEKKDKRASNAHAGSIVGESLKIAPDLNRKLTGFRAAEMIVDELTRLEEVQ